MSSLSTFGAFTTARLGIYASQRALDVVANNITNINTKGYTRQSLDQISLFTGYGDKYTNGLDTRIGNGPLVTGVNQLRDPYMDIRYRNETSTVGYYDAKLSGYEQLSNILDEVAKGEDVDGELGVIEKQFNDLIEQMQRLNTEGAGLDVYDTNVRGSASSLAKLLNSYASRLTELHETQEQALAADVDKVNRILTNIRDLNASIRKANIYGGDALEQKDQRNLLLDELSEYIRVDATYEYEDLGGGLRVEKLVVKMAGNDLHDPSTNSAVLIDGIYGAQLSINDHPKPNTGDDKDTLPYLDISGKPVADEAAAAREFDDDYAITVSQLLDRYYRPMDVPYKLTVPKTVANDVPVTQKSADAMLQALIDADLPANGGPGTEFPAQGTYYGSTLTYSYSAVENTDGTWSVKRTVSGRVQTEKDDTGSATQADDDTTALDGTTANIDGWECTNSAKNGTASTSANAGKYMLNFDFSQIATRPLTDERTQAQAQADVDAMVEADRDAYPATEVVNGVTVTYKYEAVQENGVWIAQRVADGYGTTQLTENTLYGALQAERELLSKQGEFSTEAQLQADPNANVKRGIPYYQKALDVLANQFASIMNAANMGGPIVDLEGLAPDAKIPVDATLRFSDGTYGRIDTKTVVDPNTGKEYRMFDVKDTGCLMYNADEPVRSKFASDDEYKAAFKTWLNSDKVQRSLVAADGYMTEGADGQKKHLLPSSEKQEGALGHGSITYLKDNILFSNHGNGNDPKGITAANISISKGWSEGTARIQIDLDPNHPSTANTNLNHMLYLLQSGKVDYTPTGTDLTGTANFPVDKGPYKADQVFFSGTFQQMFTENICGTLAADRNSTMTLLNNHNTVADELYVERDAVSGVDLNDEAMNMMQFQKSLNAAYRLMTVIDEALDRLINNTGIVGR